MLRAALQAQRKCSNLFGRPDPPTASSWIPTHLGCFRARWKPCLCVWKDLQTVALKWLLGWPKIHIFPVRFCIPIITHQKRCVKFISANAPVQVRHFLSLWRQIENWLSAFSIICRFSNWPCLWADRNRLHVILHPQRIRGFLLQCATKQALQKD